MSLLQTFYPKPSHQNPSPHLQLPLSSRKRNPIPNSPFVTKLSASTSPNSNDHPKSDTNPNPKTQKRSKCRQKPKESAEKSPNDLFPLKIPRKPRRGRRSEAAAVEDFIRDSLEKTFASIRKQNAEVLEGKDEILKERVEDEVGDVGEPENGEEKGKRADYVIEEEDPNWPLDADVGWGIRASDYFDKHAIKNVVVDGVEIDWEGEMDEGWVKEINCLEWESFAFHPSPLIVLVFERYNRY